MDVRTRGVGVMVALLWAQGCGLTSLQDEYDAVVGTAVDGADEDGTDGSPDGAGDDLPGDTDASTEADSGGAWDTASSGDTDAGGTPAPVDFTGPCDVAIHTVTGSYGFEVGWRLTDDQGDVVDARPPSTFSSNSEAWDVLSLADGAYVLQGLDSYGDGWNGGEVRVFDVAAGDLLTSGAVPSGGSQIDLPFTLDCTLDTGAPAGCDVQLVLETQIFGSEIGWELRDDGGTVLADAPYGALDDYQTYTYDVALAPGSYTFVGLDSFGDGWHGATFTITNGLGVTLSSGTLTTGQSQQDFPFVATCGVP